MRCKACDAEFSRYEVVWNKRQKGFEDLCRRCRKIVRESIIELDNTNKKNINSKLLQEETIDTSMTYYEDSIEETNVEEDNEYYE